MRFAVPKSRSVLRPCLCCLPLVQAACFAFDSVLPEVYGRPPNLDHSISMGSDKGHGQGITRQFSRSIWPAANAANRPRLSNSGYGIDIAAYRITGSPRCSHANGPITVFSAGISNCRFWANRHRLSKRQRQVRLDQSYRAPLRRVVSVSVLSLLRQTGPLIRPDGRGVTVRTF